MDSPDALMPARPGGVDPRWGEDEEDNLHGGFREGSKAKPRFSYTELKLLLDEVKKNRHILLKKFNRGVSVDVKKQKWAEITDQINGLGENHRESRQIMKKWADMKCDAKRRLLALRGPNGATLRMKRLGPVERMVHRILLMSPSRDGETDQDVRLAEDFPNPFQRVPYLSLSDNSNRDGCSLDMSPLSSPDLERDELMQSSSELDPAEDEAASSDLLSRDAKLRTKPVFTYSRTHQNQNPPAAPPHPPLPPSSSPSAATNGAPPPLPSSSPLAPPLHCSALLPPRDRAAQLASQSVLQQRAARRLLASVSGSLETLTRSVRQLVAGQQELVSESLRLQREALVVLRDFSGTALRMLRDKSDGGHLPAPPPGSQHQS